MAGTSYTRQSTFADGDTITATLFNTEYNQIVSAFAYASSGTTGHQHDGGAGEGGNIHTIGDQNFLNKIVVDSSNNRWGVFVEVGGSAVEQIRIQDGAIVPVTDSDIDLGTSSLEFKDGFFDGTIHVDTLDVDANATVAGTLGVTGVATVGGITIGSAVITEAELETIDTITAGTVAASKAVVVDANKDITGFRNVTLTGEIDAATGDFSGAVDIDGALDVAGTTNLDVVDIDGAVDMATTLAVAGNVDFNGDLDVDGTTNLDVVDIDGAVDIATTLTVGGNVDFNGDLDVDGTIEFDAISGTGSVTVTDILDQDDMSGNSATALATQQSIKAYVDTQITAEDLDITTDSGTIAIDLDSETLTVSGGTGLDSSATGNAVTLAIDSTVATLTGSQTLTNKSLTAPTLTGTATVASLDISGDVDVDGTLETDALTIAGVTLSETISDTVGAMVASNTETGIAVTYDDADNTLDFVIGDNAIVQSMIADDAIDSQMYVDGSIDLVHMSANSVDSDQYVDGSIDTAHIADSQITSAKIADGTIATGDIADDAVTGAKLANNIDVAGTLDVTGVLTADSNVIVAGNLTVNGTTTTLNTASLDVEDKNITINYGAGDTTGSANGAGITIQDAVDASNDATILWDTTNDEFDFSHPINVAGKVTSTGTSVFASLDISGDIDVDGTTNLDVVDIDGSVNAAAAVTINGVLTANAGAVFNEGSADVDFRVESNGNANMLFVDGGNDRVSIGHSAPEAVLDIVGNSDSVPALKIGPNNSFGFKFFDSSTNGDLIIKREVSGTDTEVLRLARSSGAATFTGAVTANAGVVVDNFTLDGTTLALSSGDMTLDAAGDIILDADGGDISFKDGGTEIGLLTNDSSNFALFSRVNNKDISFYGLDDGATIQALTLDMSAAGSATFNSDVTIPDKIIHAGDTDTYLQFNAANTFRVVAGDDERFRVAATEVCVNETGLDVDFRVESDGNDHMLFVDGGNNRVGVNTGSPAATFTVKGTANTYAGGFQVEGTDETSAFAIAHIDGSTFISGNATNDHLKIAADGSLSTPTAGTSNVRFGVNAGNSIASGGTYNVLVGDEAGTALTTGDANVAIGFSALATEDAHGFNTAVGHETLKVLNAGADAYNTAVGFRAGLSVTTGVQNTLIGSLAGDALTDADFNIAIGTDALSADTLGSRSIAIGRRALLTQNFTSATDTYNVAVGFEAGHNITTGINNTLIGGLAGDALTDADYNVAVGSGALGGDTLGSRSVAIGYQALVAQNFTSATDAYNTAVGMFAGGSVTTGVDNTLIGGLSGDAITTGAENTAVGSSSLSTNTTGAENVAIGYSALSNSTTASYNTAVGKSSLGSTTTGASNTAVGKSALAANTTGAGNSAVGKTALTTNTTGTLNAALGQDALGLNTTGDNNTAVGESALYANTTASNNTAVGKSALVANTTGDRNTAVGSGAADNLTTGAANTAIGYKAMDDHSTGNSNTAVGAYALENNTTAGDNTAVGSSSLSANTTGASNSAFGVGALGANTTASDNTAVGTSALAANTTGTYNTAFGMNSLISNVDGSRCTAIGYAALAAHDPSSASETNNTAVGFHAGNAVTTGVQNTLIGATAGDALTTGDENIVIGHGCDTSANNSTNQIVMGRGVTGNANTSLCFGEDSNDSAIAFGATSITAPSDERYKEDISDATAGLSFIKDLRPVTFKWKKEKDIPNTQRAYVADSNKRVMNDYTNHGFIAQEVKTTIDAHSEIKDGFDMWKEDDADGRQRLGPSALVPILVKAIQEQNALIEALTARITTLEG